jgi:hypothetical protein
VAALAVLAADGLAQVAETGVSAANVRVAAVGGEATGAPDRSGASGPDGGGIDLRVLLAQNAPAAAAAAQARGDAVLIAFPISAPRGVEDDVARQHGLEIVGRWDLAGYERRMIQVRVRPGRSVPALLAALRRDRRVESAQTVATYRPAGIGDLAKVEPEAGASAQPKVAPPRSNGTAAIGPGSQAKATPSGRKTPPAKTDKAAAPVVSASAPAVLRWLTADEPFVGADGRLR